MPLFAGYLPTFWLKVRILAAPVVQSQLAPHWPVALGGLAHMTVGMVATFVSISCVVASDVGAFTVGMRPNLSYPSSATLPPIQLIYYISTYSQMVHTRSSNCTVSPPSCATAAACIICVVLYKPHEVSCTLLVYGGSMYHSQQCAASLVLHTTELTPCYLMCW